MILAGAALALLSACGVDGPPRPPKPAPRTSGVTVSVEADAGVRADGP